MADCNNHRTQSPTSTLVDKRIMLMNIPRILSSISLLLLLVSGISLAAPAAYRIDMAISRDGSLIGKPAIVAEAGAEAEIRDENPLKPDEGFRILVTVSPLDAEQGGKESVKLKLTFFGRLKGDWVQRAERSVTTLSGQFVSLSFPAKPPETDGKTYDLVVAINRAEAAALAPK